MPGAGILAGIAKKLPGARHSSLAAMLRSMTLMVNRDPGDNPQKFFDVLRAMLFYIDEFP
jgi:hypothetical protein